MYGVGIGARCARKSPFVRGSPRKIGVVGEEANPVRLLPGMGYDNGANPHGPTPGLGQDGVM